MSADLCDTIRSYVRYSTVGPDGETREERNARFSIVTPKFDVPDAGLYLWEWYWEISGGTRRVAEGIAQPLPWSEFIAWATATDAIVTTFEYGILRDMDRAYCVASNEELANARAVLRANAAEGTKGN